MAVGDRGEDKSNIEAMNRNIENNVRKRWWCMKNEMEKEHGRASSKETIVVQENDATAPQARCGLGCLLRFFNALLETNFWISRTHHATFRFDSWVYVNGLLYIISLGARLNAMGKLSELWAHLDLAFLMAVSAVLLWMSCCQSKTYNAVRNIVAALFRFITVIVSARYLSLLDPPKPSKWHFIGRLLGSSHLPVVVILPAILQLPLRLEIVLNCAQMMAGLFWTSHEYCHSWFSSDGFYSVVSTVGEDLHVLISRMVLFGLGHRLRITDRPEPSQYSCWLVVSFFTVLVGVILPTAFSFVTEHFSQLMPARQELANQADNRFQVQREVVAVVVWVTLAVTVAAWIVLKAMADFEDVQVFDYFGRDCLKHGLSTVPVCIFNA